MPETNGQHYVDSVDTTTRERVGPEVQRFAEKVLAEVDKATDADDLFARLTAVYKATPPAVGQAEDTERAMILAQFAGHLQLNEEA